MTNEQLVTSNSSPMKSKLIHLEGDVKQTNRAKDINSKINLLETSLGALQEQLEVVNKSVEEGLDRLSDTDLDLTAKVSETYKRLGSIDGTYKSLIKISNDIDSEVKKLTMEMEEVAEQSAAELGRVETMSSTQIKKTNEQHQELIIRVNDLVEHSRETNKELASSVKKNTDALLALEKQLVAEIDALANTTEERDNAISTDLNEAKKTIEKNKAKIIQMQSIDEALSKRATALEISAAELTDKSRMIESSVNMLDARTQDLSQSVGKLQEQSELHSSLISGLQKTAAEIANSLMALTDREKYHFRSLTGALLLVLLLVTTLYFYQQGINETNAVVSAETNQLVDQKVASLQQQTTMAETEIAVTQNELAAINEKLEGDIKLVNSKLVNLNDQAASLDGRLNRVSPFSQFGADNIIHGPQWLAAQPGNNLVIQLAMVSDKKELYVIAQRYSHYLNEQLAYYVVKTELGEKYVLTYGSFTNKADISAALYRMPRNINFQRPGVTSIAALQI